MWKKFKKQPFQGVRNDNMASRKFLSFSLRVKSIHPQIKFRYKYFIFVWYACSISNRKHEPLSPESPSSFSFVLSHGRSAHVTDLCAHFEGDNIHYNLQKKFQDNPNQNHHLVIMSYFWERQLKWPYELAEWKNFTVSKSSKTEKQRFWHKQRSLRPLRKNPDGCAKKRMRRSSVQSSVDSHPSQLQFTLTSFA